jgi:hypothetical protein
MELDLEGLDEPSTQSGNEDCFAEEIMLPETKLTLVL